MIGSAKTNMILQPSDTIHAMVLDDDVWKCEACDWWTGLLENVVRHVVEKQFKVRDREMDFSIFS